MNNANELVSVLKSCEKKGWTCAIPASEEAIVSVEIKLNLKFPDQYRNFLLYSDGGELEIDEAFINFFDVDYLRDLNPDPVWSIDLPGMSFFGDDQGDYLYYFDPRNSLGRGSWAVYGVEKGSPDIEYSMYLAKDINCLVEKILNGEDVLNSPFLKDE